MKISINFYFLAIILIVSGNLSIAFGQSSSSTNNRDNATWFLGWRAQGSAGSGPLDVRNDFNAPIDFYTNNQTFRMRITAGGLVGIGTATPANLLTVTGGNIDISSQDYSYMFNSVAVLQTRGYSTNILVGIGAGVSITGDDRNTIVGYEAGSNTTTGEHNTYMGMASGHNGTTGKWNAYYGYNSGITNSTGIGNTFIGYKSGFSSLVDYNTFLGYHSGYNTDNGAYNLFLGLWPASATRMVNSTP